MTIQQECRQEAHQTCKRHDFRALVLDWFWNRRWTGATAEQCVDAIRFVHGQHIEKNTIAPRVTELHQAGELIATGEKRPTRSGKSATVYVHRQFAKEEMTAQQPSLFGGNAA